jgi:solute carrier family 25 carnitine/acylcarnitine transporter 20/29
LLEHILDCNYHILRNSLATVVTTPMELIKIKMQSSREATGGLMSIGKDILKKEGLQGLFRGFCAMFNRDVLAYGAYFYTYFAMRDYFLNHNLLDNKTLFFAGGTAGIVSWVFSYPFDPVKTLIQTNTQFKITQMQAFRYLFTKYGVRGLFTGLTPVLIRTFFVNGVVFCVNDKFRKILKI